jgi:hypothetical protein
MINLIIITGGVWVCLFFAIFISDKFIVLLAMAGAIFATAEIAGKMKIELLKRVGYVIVNGFIMGIPVVIVYQSGVNLQKILMMASLIPLIMGLNSTLMFAKQAFLDKKWGQIVYFIPEEKPELKTIAVSAEGVLLRMTLLTLIACVLILIGIFI